MAADDDDSEGEVFFDAQASLAGTRRSSLGSRPKGDVSLNDNSGGGLAHRSRSLPRRNTSSTTNNSNNNTRGRSVVSKTTTGSSAAAVAKRQSIQLPAFGVPEVPAIPQHFLLQAGPRVASLSRPGSASSPLRSSPPASGTTTTTSTTLATSTPAAGVHHLTTPPSRSPSLKRTHSPRLHINTNNAAAAVVDTAYLLAPEDQRPRSSSSNSTRPSPTPKPPHADSHTLSLLERPAEDENMSSRIGRAPRTQRDLFLELADDNNNMPGMTEEDALPQLRRSQSRFSQASKRRSLPADAFAPLSDRRPSTSGGSYARQQPSSKLFGGVRTDLQRHMDQYRSPTDRASMQFDGAASVSGRSASGRAHRRFSIAPERSPVSPSLRVRSPEVSPYVRGRQSLSVIASSQQGQSLTRTLDSHEEESPAESSGTKQTDSSNESQTADTVWDELDDLKSRIKQLELTGKMPAASSATASGDSSDRPRTATTAPTTIDSSPRHARKKEPTVQETPTPPPDSAMGSTPTVKVHQPLQQALAKAKPLLNNALFTTLEATVNDALQIAAMTSGQGTNDRQLRRKADTMCRNFTDLCLALCEGKHEAPVLAPSPTSLDIPQDSPSLRYSSSNLSQRIASAGRPMSRLEARRSSILGIPAGSVDGSSPRGSFGEASGAEQDSTPMHYPPLRRISRAPSNMLRSRMEEADGDDEPTIRPPSRAMTDIGAMRKLRQMDDRSPAPAPQRTPSLRESIVARRQNEGAFDTNAARTTPHSADRRRRLYEQTQSTPPVVEEEGSPEQASSIYSSAPQRRNFTSRRMPGEFPSRAASLSSRVG